jgi:hypothetical protein
MQIAIMCFCKYAANFARFLSDGFALNACINLLIYVPLFCLHKTAAAVSPNNGSSVMLLD